MEIGVIPASAQRLYTAIGCNDDSELEGYP